MSGLSGFELRHDGRQPLAFPVVRIEVPCCLVYLHIKSEMRIARWAMSECTSLAQSFYFAEALLTVTHYVTASKPEHVALKTYRWHHQKVSSISLFVSGSFEPPDDGATSSSSGRLALPRANVLQYSKAPFLRIVELGSRCG